MNPNLARLFDVARQPRRRIIGLMSGTSLDGLDVALCRFEGSGTATKVELEAFTTVPYSPDVKEEIRRVFAKPEIDFQHLCLLNAWIGNLHGDLVRQCLATWEVAPAAVDCVASHGQTVFHAPKILHQLAKFPNATLQIGDGDHVAVRTGILTLSDFRQKHVAAGGEGAPLAVYGDHLLFSQRGEDRLMLNLGGIANFTYLPGSLDPAQLFSTDVGPGNTLMDAFVQAHFPGKSFDENGAIAAGGQVNQDLLRALLDDPFFGADFPKTTGPELFSRAYVRRAQQASGTDLAPPDLLATLAQFSAEGIARAVRRCPGGGRNVHLYASGGGMHNPVLMGTLRGLLPDCRFHTTDELGIPPDAKEAVLFAVLANETLVGGQENVGDGRPGIPRVAMGKISFPR
ncbi:MAG: anhydro-N-acetylmuramic acid kinase [Ferruginibacter sp.]|nr:anhydro-N-acetylmuramic acid kinase [Cytophagales bacterium]